MNKMLRLKFYPSYAAFTFPLVISAIAIKKVNLFLIAANKGMEILKTLVLIEEFMAIVVVIYVLLRFISFLFANPLSKKEVKIKETVV